MVWVNFPRQYFIGPVPAGSVMTRSLAKNQGQDGWRGSSEMRVTPAQPDQDIYILLNLYNQHYNQVHNYVHRLYTV